MAASTDPPVLGTFLRRGRMVPLLLVATIAALLVVVVPLLAREVLRTSSLSRSVVWESPQWSVSHAEIEFLRFRGALAKVELGDLSLEELRLRYDILYSRIDTLEVGALASELRALPDFRQELEDLRNFLNQTAGFFDLGDEALLMRVPEIAALSDVASESFRNLNLIALSYWADKSVERRTYLAWALGMLAATLAVVLVLLVGALVACFYLLQGASKREQALLQANKRVQESEASLRLSEARLQESQKIAQLGSWEADADGRLIWTENVFRIFELADDEFDGTSDGFFRWVHPEDREKVRTTASEAWERASSYEVVHRLLLRSGEIKTVIERAEPLTDSSGKTTRFIGTVQDITLQTRSQEMLRQAQKMEAIGQLTGGVAHDFNNLLTVVMGNLELLGETSIDSDQRDLVDASTRAALRGAELTRNMLSFARKSHLEPVQLDLNTVVREMQKWSLRVLPATIRIETQLHDPVKSVLADQTLATNAMLNIVLNARDAMPQGGRLLLRTVNVTLSQSEAIQINQNALAAGDYVRVDIEDNGTGIDPADLKRVFDPFFSTKPPGSGTGLGLSMAMGFMEQSNGAISIVSKVGEGTKVSLYFPATGTSLQMPKEKQPARLTSTLARILLVEDESEVMDVLRRTLTQAGYDVLTARSGAEGVAVFNDTKDIDLLITDVVMPGEMQGPQLAHYCRAERADLPIILISGYSDIGDMDDLHGFVWLNKPVQRRDLVGTVAKMLSSDTTSASSLDYV